MTKNKFFTLDESKERFDKRTKENIKLLEKSSKINEEMRKSLSSDIEKYV